MNESEMYFENERGELQIKVNIIDEDDPSRSTPVVIPQACYERILSHKSTLSKFIDEDGISQFMLKDINETGPDPLNTLSQAFSSPINPFLIDQTEDMGSERVNAEFIESKADDIFSNKNQDHVQGQLFLISEFLTNIPNIFMVVITDPKGENICEKYGKLEETITLEIFGHTISYVVSGINEDGSPRETNVLFDSPENGVEETMQGQTIASKEQGSVKQNMTQQEPNTEEEFVITEQSVINKGQPKQMVTLADKSRLILDRKYGENGDSVKLQLRDKELEYVIQGPTENGEPIVTAFLINLEDINEVQELEHQISETHNLEAFWNPVEEYTTIRDKSLTKASELERTNVNLMQSLPLKQDGPFFNFADTDLHLSFIEEAAIRNAAERLQEELYQYPIKSKSDCSASELQIYNEIPRLQAMLNGNSNEVEQAMKYIRETSAVNKGTPHQNLSQHDIAENEAAFQLVKNNIGLLTFTNVLNDLAKKVVHASGCTFKRNKLGDENLELHSQEISQEIDFSLALRVLSDSLEGGPLNSLIISKFVPIIEETIVNSDEDDEDEIYRPKEFIDRERLKNVNIECEAEQNILNECVIYCHTGTDDLKKVRILDLANSSFTSIMPIDINCCYNLIELNLFNNSISYLPRCLYLPNLRNLNLKKNSFVTVPILEQFPKLFSVDLDDKVSRKLNRETLSYFCPELTYINGRKFEMYISNEFNKTLNEAQTNIKSIVERIWEEDLMMFFKQGVFRSQVQKVIETLVLGVRERKVFNEKKFLHCKDLVARRVAESFLESKIIEDDEDNINGYTDENNDDYSESLSKENTPKKSLNQTWKKKQILLQDEPLDQLTNVVGQALHCGKVVVYSVLRASAKTPGNDLIPVRAQNNDQNIKNSFSLIEESKNDRTSKPNYIRPGPASFKKRIYGITQSPQETNENIMQKENVQKIIDCILQKVEDFNEKFAKPIGRPKTMKQTMRKSQIRDLLIDQKLGYDNNSLKTDNLKSIKRASSPISKDIKRRVEEIVRTCTSPIPLIKLREMVGISTKGRPHRFIRDASDDTYRKFKGVTSETITKQNIFTEDDLSEFPINKSVLNFTPYRPQPQTSHSTESDYVFMKPSNPCGVKDSMFRSEIEEKNNSLEEVRVEKEDNECHQNLEQSITSTNLFFCQNDVNNKVSLINELNGYQFEKEDDRVDKKSSGIIVSLPESSIFTPNQPCKSIFSNGKDLDYDPKHFIRCHAPRDNSCETIVWRCAFEPNPNNPYVETTSVVATCGGTCVCRIDCRIGKVMKRYTCLEEEFHTVAWTTIEMTDGHYHNVLAAAGKNKIIRLLHPEEMVCYEEMIGHEQVVNCMTFHPRYPTVLFSGDENATVLVWDIGIFPTAPDYITNYQLLTKLVCPRAHLNPILNLIVMPSHDALIICCPDGLFVWLTAEFRKHTPDNIQHPDFEVKVPTHQVTCFDGLTRLSENIFLVKCIGEGEIFYIYLPQIIQHYRVRKFDEKNRVVADVIGQLRWQITNKVYINLTAQMNLSSVVCGDNEGMIWLYDLSKEVTENNYLRKFKCKPMKMLEWPECIDIRTDVNKKNKQKLKIVNENPIINYVEMSSDGSYLVAVTSNNLVCVWLIVT